MHKLFTKTLLGILALFAPLAHAQTGFLEGSGQIVTSIPPSYLTQIGSTSTSVAAAYANSNLAANQTITFADGNPAYLAGTNYTGATYISDTAQTMMSNPYNFKAATVLKYMADFDSKKDGSGNFPININISTAAAPGTVTATGSTTGGTLAAATYYYKVTATTAGGETTASPEASVTTTGTTSSAALTWAAITGATGYKVYRGTTAGGENVYYTTTTASYTDTGAASTAGTVPTTNTALYETSNFYSAWDTASPHKFVTGDGWIFMPWLAKVHYLITNNTSAYTTYVADMKTALANVPKDTNGLVLVTGGAGNEYIACFAFQEYMRKTGDDACASVFLATDYQMLSQLASAAGDAANVTYFNNLLSTIKTSIDTTFVDATTGLLKAATIQNAGNLDVESSALACYYNILSAARCSTISNYFNTNYSTLVNANGFIKITPTAWATVGAIPPSGGPPYNSTTTFTGSQYQGGNWTQHFAWFAHTLGINFPNAVPNLITTFLNGSTAARQAEWNDSGSTASSGSSTYMNSTAGPLAASAEFSFPVNISGASMVYPGAGLAVSTGTAWGTSLSATAPVFTGFVAGLGGTSASLTGRTDRHVLVGGGAATEVLDVQNIGNGPSAIAFTDTAGQNNTGFGLGGSAMSQVYLRNALYRYNAETGGTICDTTEVGTACDFIIQADHRVYVPKAMLFGTQGTLYSTGTANSGLTIIENNGQANTAGTESLIDTANPAARMVLLQGGGFITQTAPATTGSPSWTTQISTTGTGSFVPKTSTVAALPTASSEGAGAMRIVTDATANTGATCAGAGTLYSIAVSNGTAWTCH